ncbi:MAG: hypothetical protein Kow0070_28660 [Anaerolineales bacterium]
MQNWLIGQQIKKMQEAQHRAMDAKIERMEEAEGAALAAAKNPPVKPQRDEQAYQSYRAGERASYDNPPPPLTTRVLTIIPALVGFVVLDTTLVALTIANTVAIGIAPDPLSKGIFVANEIILSGIDLFVAYLHVSYAHWVVTGRGIHNWADIADWKLHP